ncbi:TRAPP trafficking subunit Trs65-domain-containing protein [Polychytrium aggregatum]|uniref:TRAPP trafficking subunit Trs65-domain-containing protein n=1 Tax=Polychytrium aggregatum TaxID=110093 RepID=UPI0022FE11D4|nr:TRAPP trafficking subunit Trs65-domain-containing protein [Polychytrium aggregatum]KAI9209355.1 TRAPP trafficking subunit Trs65-domain-containing protein [Polychytrium aggregatum]
MTLSSLQIESLLAEASYECIVPAIDSVTSDCLEIPLRDVAYWDEVLSFYLCANPSENCPIAATAESLPSIAQAISIQITATLTSSEFPSTAYNSSESLADVSASASYNDMSAANAEGIVANPSLSVQTTVSALPAAVLSTIRGNYSVPIPGLNQMKRNPAYRRDTINSPIAAASPMAAAATRRTRGSTIAVISSRPSDSPVVESAVSVSKEPAEEVMLSYTYHYTEEVEDLPILLTDGRILFPLKVPLEIIHNKAGSSSRSKLVLNISVAPKPSSWSENNRDNCDLDTFDAVNLLEGLSIDQYFNPHSIPSHRLSHQHRRIPGLPAPTGPTRVPKVVRMVLPLSEFLTVRFNTNLITPETMILSVNISNNHTKHLFDFIVSSVRVEMTNAMVAYIQGDIGSALPVTLKPLEEIDLVYKVSFLDAGSGSVEESQKRQRTGARLHNPPQESMVSLFSESNQMGRLINVLIEGIPSVCGIRGQTVWSEYYCWAQSSPGIGIGTASFQGTGIHGRKHLVPKRIIHLRSSTAEKTGETVGGVSIVFTVVSPVSLCKIFSIQAFFVNKTSRIRNFSLIIPQAQKRDKFKTATGSSFESKLSVSYEEMVESYTEDCKTDASLVCLESEVKLGPLRPNTCQSVYLHFIATKGNFHTLETIQVLDRDSGKIEELKNVLQIYVKSTAAGGELA